MSNISCAQTNDSIYIQPPKPSSISDYVIIKSKYGNDYLNQYNLSSSYPLSKIFYISKIIKKDINYQVVLNVGTIALKYVTSTNNDWELIWANHPLSDLTFDISVRTENIMLDQSIGCLCIINNSNSNMPIFTINSTTQTSEVIIPNITITNPIVDQT